MGKDIEHFLSQCCCAIKKVDKPHKYSTNVHITANHPLHTVAIDLYTFDGKLYFTALDIYTKLSWVAEVNDKQSSTILKAYERFISLYAEPVWLSCDNGSEFSLITTPRTLHPSEHPESNGVLERFHKELGKMARILEAQPDLIYERLNSEKSVAEIASYLENLQRDPLHCVMVYQARKFHYNDLVWRAVPERKREKAANTYTGPHRVINQTGKFSYEVTSHLGRTKLIHININDCKRFYFPDTTNWVLNPSYFTDAVSTLGSTVRAEVALLNFSVLPTLVSDVLQGKKLAFHFFVVPEWPCMDWYKPLHDNVTAEAVKLPDEPDLFLTTEGKPIGKLAWSNWLFELK
jgi:hypothetical protein